MKKATTFVFGAALGCAFGTLAALALAPQSGAETREFVAERVGSATLKGSAPEESPTNDELKAKIAEVRARIEEKAATVG